MVETLAPCVAVVGPANSGKTTLLHLLDRALQLHPVRPLVYVVKGNPDGTGRYLFHAPELREPLKERVKGVWCATTVETVCGWVESCRRHLDLVLVDLGGRHAPGNERIFERCSHALVVARRFADRGREREEGMESWVRACRRSGLGTVSRLRSVAGSGRSRITSSRSGLTGVFRGDAAGPEDSINRPVVDALVEALLALAPACTQPRYLDLRLERDWTAGDLARVGGRLERIRSLVAAGESLVLGGRAPVWAYAAALHRALDVDPAARGAVFDPKVPAALVPIPAHQVQPAADWIGKLETAWRWTPRGDEALLDLRITTPDRFLPLPRPDLLAALPRPDSEPPSRTVVVSGAAPIWLHLALSRWLRGLPGERTVGIEDARMGAAVLLSGPRSPAVTPLPPTIPPSSVS